MRQDLFESGPLAPEHVALDADHSILRHRLPAALIPDSARFETLWRLHPADYHTLIIHGRAVQTPRWQQAYGQNYRYTGARQNALPVPAVLESFLTWSRTSLDERLNGLLLNWYDARERHYIGAHRDDTRDLVPNRPIVTLSFGESRVFRLRPWKGKGFVDVPIKHGDVLVIPWATNLAWTHEVPHFARYHQRRISVTLRAFKA